MTVIDLRSSMHPVPPDLDLARCSQENIHIPNAIQPHGALLAARTCDLVITHASANLAAILGKSAAQALGRPIREIIGDAAWRVLLGASSRSDPGSSQANVRTTVDGVSFHLSGHRSGSLLCIDIEPALEDFHGLPINMVQSILETFDQATTRAELFKLAVSALRDLTGYDRVMAYRFGPTGDGQVIAEVHEPDLLPYLNLRYPASDIPEQARRQYMQHRIGMIANSAYQPVPLLVHPTLHDGTPLDLTYSALRSVSPVHCAYMRNMETAASLTIGLVSRRQLWGMLVCHHRIPRISGIELRVAASMIGLVVSLLVGSLRETENFAIQAQRADTLCRLVDKLASPDALPATFIAASPELLKLVEADGALIRCDGILTRIGHLPSETAAKHALSCLHHAAAGKLLAVNDLSRTLPECLPEAAGALMLPLSIMTDDAILWFRRELSQTILWGGDPGEHATADPVSGAISPRRSFAIWKEVVRGQSEAWQDADIALAEDVRFVVEFEIARRAKARLQQDLLRSNADLEEFAYAASHDLKAPLRAITHLAGWIGEDIVATASHTTMANLKLLQGRAARLQRLLHGLLSYARIGAADPDQAKDVDLALLVHEIADLQGPPPGFVVTCEGPLAPLHTDGSSIQVVLQNLIANSIKHHDRLAGRITVSMQLKPDDMAEIRVSDDGPGIEPRYHDRIFLLFQTLVSRDVNEASGIGLAIVKKRILANGGRIWVESVPPARGTTITFTWKNVLL